MCVYLLDIIEGILENYQQFPIHLFWHHIYGDFSETFFGRGNYHSVQGVTISLSSHSF